MRTMMSLQQIRDALADRRLDIVAKATGLHANSVGRIRDGRNLNPKASTLEALSRYLEAKP
jgi:hypothetical protein